MHNALRKYQWLVLTPSLLLSSLAMGTTTQTKTNQTAEAASPPVTENVTVMPTEKMTPTQRELVSSMSVKALRHITEAQASLAQKRYSPAAQELSQANTLLEMIRVEVPEVTVKDRIAIARKHLEYKDTEKVEPDLVPIYSQLDILPNVPNGAEARLHLDKAREDMKKGNKQEAQRELARVNDLLVFTQVSLPLAETQSDVRAAQKALKAKNYKAATTALAHAENALQLNVLAAFDKPQASPRPEAAASTGSQKGATGSR